VCFLLPQRDWYFIAEQPAPAPHLNWWACNKSTLTGKRRDAEELGAEKVGTDGCVQTLEYLTELLLPTIHQEKQDLLRKVPCHTPPASRHMPYATHLTSRATRFRLPNKLTLTLCSANRALFGCSRNARWSSED